VEEEPFVSQWAFSIQKVPLFHIRRKKFVTKSSSSLFLFLLKNHNKIQSNNRMLNNRTQNSYKIQNNMFIKTTTNGNKHQNSNQIVQFKY
jgi:hypothetical protein